MKHAKHNDPVVDETRDEMREARKLIRKGTSATLALAPVGFGGRIVWTGHASLADIHMDDPWLDAINFVPTPVIDVPRAEPPLTIELKLHDAMSLSIDDDAEYGGLALHWQTPLGQMELALYDDRDRDLGD